MKRSDLKQYVKEQIVSTLDEATLQADKSDSSAIAAAKKAAGPDDVVNIAEVDGDDSDNAKLKQISAELKKASELHKGQAEKIDKMLEKTIKSLSEAEDSDEEGDKEAAKGARKNASKTKRLDAKIKAKKEIEADMKTILNKYKKAEGEDKNKFKEQLKVKTALKKETEAEIKTLESDII